LQREQPSKIRTEKAYLKMCHHPAGTGKSSLMHKKYKAALPGIGMRQANFEKVLSAATDPAQTC
jgi:hypothetical protein